jgi:hypothetical protein
LDLLKRWRAMDAALVRGELLVSAFGVHWQVSTKNGRRKPIRYTTTNPPNPRPDRAE